jgi:hypothetical protein
MNTTSAVSAGQVFELLCKHFSEYADRIETKTVISDIDNTFGVKLDANAVTYRLRAAVKRGLLMRVGTKSEGYWVFTQNAIPLISATGVDTAPLASRLLPAPPQAGRRARPVTRQEMAQSPQYRRRGGQVKNADRRDVEAFIVKNKRPGETLQFTVEQVKQSIRHRRVYRKKLRKAIENMTYRKHIARGPKSGQRATYLVTSDNFSFALAPRNNTAATTRAAQKPDASRRQAVTSARRPAVSNAAFPAAFADACRAFEELVTAVVRCVDSIRE